LIHVEESAGSAALRGQDRQIIVNVRRSANSRSSEGRSIAKTMTAVPPLGFRGSRSAPHLDSCRGGFRRERTSRWRSTRGTKPYNSRPR
jgi:hypothetical protein